MTRPKTNKFTVMLVPDRHSTVRKFQFSRRLMKAIIGAALLLALTVVGGGVHYAFVVDDALGARSLRKQNLELRAELNLLQGKVGHLTAAVDRVERLDTKLRMLAQLNDPERSLAMGPVEEGRGPGVGFGEVEGELALAGGLGVALGDTDGMDVSEVVELLKMKLDNLEADARGREASLHELNEYYQDQSARLAAMPAVWPSRGWVTSTFGVREDPFTGSRKLHAGVDIAAQSGAPVVAPAAGTVIFAGTDGGYGNLLVLDHGYGVQTIYGHLSEFKTKVGAKVERGDDIGLVGNTGRSTGPHLHYEVKVNGVPQNPSKFILD